MKKNFLFKVLLIVLSTIIAFSFVACNNNNGDTIKLKGSVQQDGLAVYIKPDKNNQYVGDPMPYFDGENMNVFYLFDQRSAGAFHPWNLFSTNDMLTWEDKGTVIDVVEDVTSPDYALGTGCVIKDSAGLYHAFYTGYNGFISQHQSLPYKEKIQHATSTDLSNWTKHSEHGFYGGMDDFRDPYVIYMPDEGKYWMLVTTRAAGKGVIKLFKSIDLITWGEESIFYDNGSRGYNMECPTLIKFNNYWYLSFSEQSDENSAARVDRVMRYRYKQNLTDAEWIEPETDYVNGAGFYAGRMEHYKDGRMLAFGWIPTKISGYDERQFDWGGNLVALEIRQTANGELYAEAPVEIANKLSTEVEYKKAVNSGGVTYENNKIAFDGSRNGAFFLFEELETKPTKMSFSITPSNNDGIVQIAYGAEDKNINKAVSIYMDLTSGKLNFYAGSGSGRTLIIQSSFKTAQKYDCTVITENDCLTFYINENMAMSTRIYKMTEDFFGFVSDSFSYSVSDIKFFE